MCINWLSPEYVAHMGPLLVKQMAQESIATSYGIAVAWPMGDFGCAQDSVLNLGFGPGVTESSVLATIICRNPHASCRPHFPSLSVRLYPPISFAVLIVVHTVVVVAYQNTTIHRVSDTPVRRRPNLARAGAWREYGPWLVGTP